MAWITKEGRTVDEAQDAAIAASGMPSDELEIEVVSEGAKGLFGLGGEPAVVRVRPKGEAADVREAFQDDITPKPGERAEEPPVERPAPPAEATERDETTTEREPQGDEEEEDDVDSVAQREEALRIGTEMLSGILKRMGLDGELKSRIDGGTVYLEVFGEDMGILIGRSGTTLEALQELVRAGVQRKLQKRQSVVVDVESYWERRREGKGGGGGGGGGSRQGGGRGRRGGRRGGRRQRRGGSDGENGG